MKNDEGLLRDDEFIAAFENCSLAKSSFDQADHVRMAFLYLRRYPAAEAIQRFSCALRNFAAQQGKPERYHETITWAFLLLTGERMARNGGEESWEEFSRRNPDLLDWKNNILKKYYREETLATDLARKMFLLPDNIAAL